MKKLVTSLLVGALCVGAATTGFAAEGGKDLGAAKKVDGSAITIDGKMDEAVWKDALKVDLNRCFTNQQAEADRASGTAYILWSEDALYVAMDIKDKTMIPPSETCKQDINPWNANSVEVI